MSRKNKLSAHEVQIPNLGYEEVNSSDRVFEQDGQFTPSAEDRLLAPLKHAELVVNAGIRAGRSALEGVVQTLRTTDQIHQAGRAARFPKREE